MIESEKTILHTTDNYEAKPNHHYMLEDGTDVLLDFCATAPSGETLYRVTPIYEGDAMEVCNHGGNIPSERTIPYEHHGESILVRSIFKNAPVRKMNAEYAEKLKSIGKLGESIKGMTGVILELTTRKDLLEAELPAERACSPASLWFDLDKLV